jgi:hypothetical protein
MILAVFVTVLMYMYSRSSDSFKITLWKQQRTAQSEMFWTFMRKHLEEATHDLQVEAFVENPNVTISPKHLKFHPTPGNATGTILAWNCSKVKFEPSLNHSVSHSTVLLNKTGPLLELVVDGKTVAKLNDVDNIDFKITSVHTDAANEEFLNIGADPDAVGSIIEISLVLSPPDGYLAESQRIVQNHKFRLNVGAVPDSSPAY